MAKNMQKSICFIVYHFPMEDSSELFCFAYIKLACTILYASQWSFVLTSRIYIALIQRNARLEKLIANLTDPEIF